MARKTVVCRGAFFLSTGGRHRLLLTLLWVSCCGYVSAFQLLMHGTRPGAPPALVPEDEAVLDSPESRQDLPRHRRSPMSAHRFAIRNCAMKS